MGETGWAPDVFLSAMRFGSRFPVSDREWMEHAACKPSDHHLFYPTSKAADAADAAKAICDTCPVKADCLEYAVATRQVDGIWGGTTERERDRLIRARRRGNRNVHG